jgi:hypothetical protein
VPSPSPSPTFPALSSPPAALASHPQLSAPDLCLHQFFAQHRPHVLSQSAAALFDAPPTLALGPTPQAPLTGVSTRLKDGRPRLLRLRALPSGWIAPSASGERR